MRRLLGILGLVTGVAIATLGSMQQTQYPGEVPQSSQANLQAQNARDALGVALLDLLGPSCGSATTYGGCYDGLTITAVSGSMNVTVNAAANGGRIYQVVASNPNPMPSSTPTPPAPATPVPGATLPPDTQNIITPAMQVGNSANLSVPAPGTSGQSVYYLVEAQVTPAVPTNEQVSTFFNSGLDALWSTTVPLALNDTITYQAKAGTAGTSPTVPSLDAGWVALGTVLVPYGATSCATSCTIAQYPALGGLPICGAFCAVTNANNNFSTAQSIQGLEFTSGAGTGASNLYIGGGGLSNTTGYSNTANGFQALFSNTTGSNNTANGFQALFSNTTGSNNTANGIQALFSNTTGSNNTANGLQALASNTTGGDNTANGFQALFYNTTGSSNTANGINALSSTTGSNNTANGLNALSRSTTGNDNTSDGSSPDAGSYGQITTGSQNISLGYDMEVPSPTANGQLDIANAIYGLNNTGTQTTLSTGCIAFYATTCTNGTVAFGVPLTLSTALGTANGGTNQTSWTSGDCVRASSATTLASAAGDCVTSVPAGNGITSSGGTTPSISVTGCGAATCREKILVVLGAVSGTVATSDTFFPISLPNYSGGVINELHASCLTHDNGSTVLTLYTVNATTGAQTSAGTLTLSSSNYETDGSITAVSLTYPESLIGAITTAGTGAYCSFSAEGYQDVF